MEKLAFVVAIEEYQSKNGLSRVDFAKNDALEFTKILHNIFKFEDDEIKIYLDSDATLTTVQNDIRYELENFKGDFFVFYYAGHGFYDDGNMLSVYDTHSVNIKETSFSLEEEIANRIKIRNIKKSLFFIDSCASEIKTKNKSRSVVSEMNIESFNQYLDSNRSHAIFFSCSPNEKSYPDEALSHGIWTYFLLKALSGEANEAFCKNRIITGSSLQDYLRTSVSTYIKERKLKKIQTPIAKIISTGEFEITRFKNEDIVLDEYASTLTSGKVIFNYSDNNGVFRIGNSEYCFDIKFSKASNRCIYIYNDPNNIDVIAKANGIKNIYDITDAEKFNYTSRVRTLNIGEIGVFKNEHGYYAAIKILSLKDDSRGDNNDEVEFEFNIQTSDAKSFFKEKNIEIYCQYKLPDLTEAKYVTVCPRCKYSGPSFYENACPNQYCGFVYDD